MTTENVGAESVSVETMAQAEGNPPAENPAEGNPPAAPEVTMDEATRAEIVECVRLLRAAESKRTAAHLRIGEILVGTIRRKVIESATDRDSVPIVRKQAVNMVALAISAETGWSFSDSRILETLRAHYLRESMPETDRKSVERVAWDSLRVLNRWAIPADQRDPFDYERGAEYAERWAIKPDCGQRLAELVKALAVKGKTPAKVRELMDAHESALREAELALMDDAARAQAEADADAAKRKALIDARHKFVSGIPQAIAKLRWKPEDFFDALTRAEMIPAAFSPARLDKDSAASFARSMIAADRLDAALALAAILSPWIAAQAKPTQGIKGATDTLDALGATRKIA